MVQNCTNPNVKIGQGLGILHFLHSAVSHTAVYAQLSKYTQSRMSEFNTCTVLRIAT